MKKTKINIPTKITIARILVIVLMLIGLIVLEILKTVNPLIIKPNLYVGNTNINLIYLILCIIFIIAALTDMLDGYLARKWHQVTDLGKFLDPVADKLLVNSMLIFLTFPHAYTSVEQTRFPLFCAIIMVARDIVVDCLRFVAAKKNVVIAANAFGKAKTIAQMITIPLFFLNGWPFSYIDKAIGTQYHELRIVSFFAYITTLISLVSGIIYVIQNRKVFFDNEQVEIKNNNHSAKDLIELLTKKKLTIGSIESLTAGKFTSTLASIPGASKVIKGGIVTYQSEVKTKLLGIPKNYINKYGVVSKQVANQMAVKGLNIINSDIIVSFTGNAGPTKEKGDAEVGRVYFSILCKLDKKNIKNFTKVYKGDRNTIRTDVINDCVNEVYNLVSSSKL